MILTGINQHLETTIEKSKNRTPLASGIRAGTDWERAEGAYRDDGNVLYLLIGFRVYRCIHLSKLDRCT